MNSKMGISDKDTTYYRVESRIWTGGDWYRWENVYDTIEAAQKLINNNQKLTHNEYRIAEVVTKTTTTTTDRVVVEYLHAPKVEQKKANSHYVIQFRFKNEPFSEWMILAGKYSESTIDAVLAKHRANDERWDYRTVLITEEVTDK